MTPDRGPFIAVTDQGWFDYLSGATATNPLDEVNFWSPKALTRLREFRPGEPVFFRLKDPVSAIAGYGFFAHFIVVDLRAAWQMFDWRNGAGSEAEFLMRIARLRNVPLENVFGAGEQLGCTILREAVLWPESAWIPWGLEMGWHRNVVRGSTEQDSRRADLLMATVEENSRAELARGEFADAFTVPVMDQRIRTLAESVKREGQGTFKARLLDAYGRRCAITGERTEPVLDAAHITPYVGTASNHVQNGLILTKEFHALYDQGFVGITPERVVKVSPLIRDRWSNGRRYYDYDNKPLREPARDSQAASPLALDWHMQHRYRIG